MKKTLSIFLTVVLFGACNVFENKTEALFKAIASGDVPRVEKLIKSGADVNARKKFNSEAIMAARGLPGGGTDTEIMPLLVAVDYCQKDKKICAEMIQLLVDSGADVNAEVNGYPLPVMLTIFLDDTTYSILIKAGANIAVQDKETGFTPLMMAAMQGNVPLIKLLLASKADPNQKDNSGGTAVFQAANCLKTDKAVCADAVKALIGAGADVNVKGKGGLTPMLSAAMGDNPYTIKVLAQAKADVNAKFGTSQMTPLMIASSAFSKESVDAVKALLEAGADPKLKNSKGETASDIAFNAKNKALFFAARMTGVIPKIKGKIKEEDLLVMIEKFKGGTAQSAADEEVARAKRAVEIYNILKQAENKK